MSAANPPSCRVRCLNGETNRNPRYAVDSARYFTARTPEADHRFSIRASPQKNDIACKIVMRELQSDDLNVESLHRARISDRQMRFVQSACEQITRALLARIPQMLLAGRVGCCPSRNLGCRRYHILRKRPSGREGRVSSQTPHESFCPSRATC